MSVFSESKLPTSFLNEVETNSDSTVIVRSNIKTLEDCNKWIKEFGELTRTKWNSRTSYPSGQKIACSVATKKTSKKKCFRRLLRNLLMMKSQGNWERFLHTSGCSIPSRFRSGAAIHVQPTSIARRSVHLTKGSKRLPVGRPTGAPPNKKRKHSLSLNVKLNQPNAKRH